MSVATCALSASGSTAVRSVPECPRVEDLSIDFNGETIKGFALLIDARTLEEKSADRERGFPAGPVIVFFQGHAQRPDGAYDFTSKLALMSRSGLVVVPVCDTPYGTKEDLRGDSGKDIILMEIVRMVLAREGISVRGFRPVSDAPVSIDSRHMTPEPGQNHRGAGLANVGWSHGGILARRIAHAYPASVLSIGQVCPAGYERRGPWNLTGSFALESVRIFTKVGNIYGEQVRNSAWGFTKGFAGDFFRSVPAAAAGLQPGKVSRIFKDVSDCSVYCDSASFQASHLGRIAVIFAQDDSCMDPRRQLGIKDTSNVTRDDLVRFSRRFYSDVEGATQCLSLRVLPGTHLAPASHSGLYARAILADIGELREE